MLKPASYQTAGPTWVHDYLWNPVESILQEKDTDDKRVFEIGCGNGSFANRLSEIGYKVTGIDPSESGIAIAKANFPHLDLSVGSAYEDLAQNYGQFPYVICLEVIEHCYYPRAVAKVVYELLEDGGTGIITTPYHGYLKNLALVASGRFDSHFSPLWDGGHIKFFSMKTLRRLLNEAGFQNVKFRRVGRVSALAKSMIAIVQKPG